MTDVMLIEIEVISAILEDSGYLTPLPIEAFSWVNRAPPRFSTLLVIAALEVLRRCLVFS